MILLENKESFKKEYPEYSFQDTLSKIYLFFSSLVLICWLIFDLSPNKP